MAKYGQKACPHNLFPAGFPDVWLQQLHHKNIEHPFSQAFIECIHQQQDSKKLDSPLQMTYLEVYFACNPLNFLSCGSAEEGLKGNLASYVSRKSLLNAIRGLVLYEKSTHLLTWIQRDVNICCLVHITGFHVIPSHHRAYAK